MVDSLAIVGAAQVQATGLRPHAFGRLDGFAFDLAYVQKNGLEPLGLVVGAVEQSKLHLIVCTGVRPHHFPKYRLDVERLIESVRMR